MKRILYTILAAVISVGCTADLENQTSVNTQSGEYADKIINSSQGAVKGSILVRFNADAESRLATRSGSTRTGVVGVDAILDEIGALEARPVFTIAAKNREKMHARGLHLWYKLTFDSACDIDAVAAKLAKVGEVRHIEFEYEMQRISNPQNISAQLASADAQTRLSATKNLPFNDFYGNYQWGLANSNNNPYIDWQSSNWEVFAPIAEADINVLPAWKLCKGDPSIIVAVVDEGVMYSHEDLDANMWVNIAEKNGVEGVDDDENGFVDDIHGFNFVMGVRNTATNKWERGALTWDRVDSEGKGDTGHGTHVAGIISAINNNGKGICGIAGGSGNGDGVKILSVQAFSAGAGTTSAEKADAITYAANCGAHILQCSWGFSSGNIDDKVPTNDKGFRNNESVLAKALDYFIAEGGSEDGPLAGGLAIFASGNDGENLIGYPAGYEPCIAVGSFGPALRPAYYSNYGPGTDIMAPGGEALYPNGSIFSTLPHRFSDGASPNYGMMQGTSQACPHVSGVAALGLSYAKQLGKRYTAEEFRSMLISATNDIEPYLEGSVANIPWRNNAYKTMNYSSFKGKRLLGAGYIDAHKLLLQVEGTPYITVKSGEEQTINLATYFGDGLYNAYFSKAEEVVEADNEGLLEIGAYSKGNLTVKATKSGVTTLSVTLLVGGGSLQVPSKPFPTEVTKRIVIISRSTPSTNNGWL